MRGIEHLHVNSTMHRDLKPANILVDAENVIKIADLGLSKTFGQPLRACTNKVEKLSKLLAYCKRSRTRFNLTEPIRS